MKKHYVIDKMSRLYTLICSLSPILVIYSFTYNSFTVLDTLIVLYYLLFIPYSLVHGGLKINKLFLLLFAFVTLHTTVDYIGNGKSEYFLRGMHLANYIVFLSLFNRRCFKEEFAANVVIKVAIFSTLYLLLQHFVYQTIHFPLPGQLPIYQVNDEYGLGGVAAIDLIRFSSFFLEPSHYAMYVLCALALELFYKQKANYLIVFILCLGVIVSTSNTALAGTLFLLLLYVWRNGMSIRVALFLMLSAVVVFFVAHTYVEANIMRIESGNSMENRFNGYSQINSLLSANPLWGIGFWSGKEMGEDYLPGWARLYVYFGMIGFLYYGFVYLALFRSISKKILFLLVLLLNLGGDAFFSVYFLFYSSLFILKRDSARAQVRKI